MPIKADYLGMGLSIDDLDGENLAYFKHCAEHNFHLQPCADCKLLRYPPTTACPWCMSRKAHWAPVEGKGAVHSYTEVHHAIQPAFKAHTPYLILLVDLDTQKGKPDRARGPARGRQPRHARRQARPARHGARGRHRHARAHGVRRRRPGLALPQWTIDESRQAARHSPGAIRRSDTNAWRAPLPFGRPLQNCTTLSSLIQPCQGYGGIER